MVVDCCRILVIDDKQLKAPPLNAAFTLICGYNSIPVLGS